MRKISLWTASIAVTFALAAGTASAQFVPLDMQGQKFSKFVDMGPEGSPMYSIPLPQGEWTFVRGNETTTNGSGSKMRQYVLSDVTGGKLNMSVYLNVKVDGITTRWGEEPCKINDAIYRNDYGTALWDQRCTTIRMGAYLQQSDDKVQQISRDYYAKLGIKHSYNNLGVTMTQYTRGGKYLFLQFYVFPEAYGFENPTTSVLAASPWHASNYKSDPKKVKFIDALTKWAETYSDALFKNFQDGKTKTEIPAFSFIAEQ